tara:strand:+ start:86 stop:1141 length:1056 start_codon:yes stop_codon:yes gene_type:complete
MAYTTVNKSTANFNTKLYTGNAGTNAITGVGFQPDWVWLKRRDGTGNHNLYDAVRGTTKYLESSSTAPEQTQSYGLTAFGTDGFTLGSNTNMNGNGQSFVSWNWKAGNSSGSSNGSGSITSTVSANTTAGFSIVKWTGNGSAGATVGHGLGAVPRVIIVKNLTDNGTGFYTYAAPLGNTKGLFLHNDDAEASFTSVWNSTTPTNNLITLGTNTGVNASSKNYVAYCFTNVTGYSKFDYYTGNANTDGTFVYTGFKPKFVIIKRYSDSGKWVMQDNKRSTAGGSNPNDDWLYANGNDAEYDASSYPLDLVSNGFKIRHSNGSFQNNPDGATYLYLAFGQTLVGSNNTPNTAR